MKNPALIIIGLILSLQTMAQKPEPIYGFARERKSVKWYNIQRDLWKKEVETNPKNANAWYNYYRVTKNLVNCDTMDKRPRHERWNDLKAIVETMEKHIPETYEYNYCKFSIEGNNFDFLPYLLKADELSNGRTIHTDYMINWGEIERNIERRDKYCHQWFESGNVSPGLMYYNYNVMIGVKPNAIILTAGDNDTYPAWILQAKGVRKDVLVLNFSLMRIDAYRAKIFKQLGIETWDFDLKAYEKDSNHKVKNKFEEELLRHLIKNKYKYPVYLALTAFDAKSYNNSIADKLYLTGLTYEYSEKPIDNIAIMKRNFEQNFALDYIEKPFYQDISAPIVKSLHANYIVPMIKLYEHYKLSGETQKMTDIKADLLAVSKGSEEEKSVIKLLETKE